MADDKRPPAGPVQENGKGKVRSRETGGAGLGLAIATRAVAVHGGHIDLSSMPGCGSTFRVRIPEDKAQKGTRSSYSEKT